ncbi:proheparin-binding EGF-like growth factor [Gadus macrocephalus]|uniref:proheparin-binding EGF-like growth factor n=1 Tax=Gadus macrocephalus TaxID=80720 RepID=UPI0028CB1E3A|nr:proheparin-binding EGF-like growth factor [Gadus macrocephalus]
MNSLNLAFLLYLVCSVVGALGSVVTFSAGLPATGALTSGGGVLGAPGDDDETSEDLSDELSGGTDSVGHVPLHALSERPAGESRRRKGNKRRNKHKGKRTTTPSRPGNSTHPDSYTPAHSLSTTLDPCTSSHLGFCIHGYCKYMEDLREPVCVCTRGYDGLRCGIQTLESRRESDKSGTEVVQMVLVIIAVVLSVISCTAILLMTCAHYRTHKNFMAAYLGSGAEVEKLQKPIANVMV